MGSVVTIGSSLVDIFVHSDEFHLQPSNEGLLLCQKYGEKIEVSNFTLRTGGGGSNTAVGFTRLGQEVQCVTELGKDAWADTIVRDFQVEHVSIDHVIFEKKEQTGGSVILVGADGGRTVLVHRGAASLLDPADIPMEPLLKADWIHLSSISGQKDTLDHIFAIRKQSGLEGMSWNPGKRELDLLAKGDVRVSDLPVQVLILNRQEWDMVTQVQKSLLEQVPEIIITDGDAGGQFIVRGERKQFSIERVESLDDTGAGDAFATGYVAGRLAGELPETAIRWATVNSRSVVQHIGAKPGLLTKSALEQAIVLV